ncbi:MAG TPA: PAS domain S-box protein, partial [Burkholderiaceae bacterium]|nr:PAS domain S-box protein [Burkholderiaceae bacterium]
MNRFALFDPSDAARALIARRVLVVCAVVFGAGALLLLTTPMTVQRRAALVAGFVAVALGSLLASRWHDVAARWAVMTVNVAALAMLAWYAASSGLGLTAPALGAVALMPAVIGVAVGSRAGVATAIICVSTLLPLAWAEYSGTVAGVAALTEISVWRRLSNLLLLTAAGLTSGLVIDRALLMHRRASQDREARFNGLLGIAVDTYWELDASFKSTTVWRRGADNRFVKVERSLPAPWELATWETDAEVFESHQADLVAHKPFRDLHTRWRMPDGGVRHELISGEPRFDANGRFIGYWGVGRNITADVQLQESARASEARYRDLFDVSPLALVIHQGWTVVDANPAAVTLFGYRDAASMRSQNLLQHLGAAEQALAQQRLRAVEAGERLAPAVYRWTTHDGRRPILRAIGSQLEVDGKGCVLSIFDDITELHEAQEALRRSETTLLHLVTTSPDLITLTDLETGRYVMVNDTFTRFTGFTRDEAIGHTALELGIWTDPSARATFVATLRKQGQVSDWPQEFVSRSGERFSLLLSAAQFDLEGRRYLVLNGRDISETERTRLAHEAVLDNASLGIAFTRDRKFVQANPALEQMLGWERGTLAGQPGLVVWSSVAEYERIGAQIGPQLARGESVEFIHELTRRDGAVFWCRMLAKAVDPTHPLRGGTIWIVEDITERRRAEQALAKARDDAEAANRAKSAFLANTSHEIRTPLNGLVGLARLARRPDVDEAQRRQYLDQFGDSAETLTAVISDVLDLSKIEAGKLPVDHIAFDLVSLLESVGRVYGTLADARGLTFTQSIDPALPRRAMGDPVRLRQILTNYL